jgi:hypothetical protein
MSKRILLPAGRCKSACAVSSWNIREPDETVGGDSVLCLSSRDVLRLRWNRRAHWLLQTRVFLSWRRCGSGTQGHAMPSWTLLSAGIFPGVPLSGWNLHGVHGSSVLPVLLLRYVLGWGGCHISDELLWYAVFRGEVRADWGYIGIGSDLLIVPRRHVHALHGS